MHNVSMTKQTFLRVLLQLLQVCFCSHRLICYFYTLLVVNEKRPNIAEARLTEFINFNAKFSSLEGYVLSDTQITLS
jgi:hypothetical protein